MNVEHASQTCRNGRATLLAIRKSEYPSQRREVCCFTPMDLALICTTQFSQQQLPQFLHHWSSTLTRSLSGFSRKEACLAYFPQCLKLHCKQRVFISRPELGVGCRECILSFQDGIYKLILSPDGSTLAAIHYSGRFTLLEVPSLRIRETWAEDAQVSDRQVSDLRYCCVCQCHKIYRCVTWMLQAGYDEVNQEVASNPKKRKQMKGKTKKGFCWTSANTLHHSLTQLLRQGSNWQLTPDLFFRAP